MLIADYINALPDSYKKTAESNNYKLLLLEERLVRGLRDDIEAVQATMDIQTATGATLDLYGTIYNQARGSLTDEQYRYVIMQRVARNMVDGSYNKIAESLAVAFNTSPTAFKLAETSNPAEVEILDLPYSVLQTAGLTASQMVQIIRGMLPVGVKLAPISLEGTFEFAASAEEYDENAGFGNIDQTIGGYFGFLEAGDIDIPI